MSREHLCRAKKKNWRELPKGEQWVYGYYAEIGGESVIIKKEWHYAYSAGASPQQGKANDIVDIDQDTVCQYTGVTDENGRKIFEGDIVTINGEDEHFVVKWDDDTARFVMSSGTLVVDFDNYWGHEVEVIGNMHDNPEFLENEIDAKELRELSDAYTACDHSDAGRKFRQAANTIEALSAKLAAANMERSDRCYEYGILRKVIEDLNKRIATQLKLVAKINDEVYEYGYFKSIEAYQQARLIIEIELEEYKEKHPDTHYGNEWIPCKGKLPKEKINPVTQDYYEY